jgi:Fe-S cluster biogenesis protein NfuA
MTKAKEGGTKVRTRKKPTWHQAFLSTLAKTGIVSVACASCGIARRSVYKAKNTNKLFAKKWDDAVEEAADNLETIALQRATRSTDPSDTLLIFLLKARRPKLFRDNYRVEHAGDQESPLLVEHGGAVVFLPSDGFDDAVAKYKACDSPAAGPATSVPGVKG